ncbi:receptor-like protein kinase ANXUR2 [Trifolium pratense]|uniref:receptor-like protein kinase ANXUR2 n=1 Tax=Trifolium pratense TaxID=57577 RepID=UPI001E6947F4|nr:receptor-like protein kinase ANXUR2 [Trifolium pratense]XP_045796062.1 receptor-like protein kinase ANXUR2 [Trifolium pratense]XP_045796063.1 receptor-like protein kinase ANXUR2 [Trifolium pratense]
MNVKYSKHKSSYKKQFPTFIRELCHQFSLNDLKKSTNNFDKDRQIGESQYYIVYEGYLKHNGENDYPIAVMRMRNIVDEWFQKEIELNCQLCHPNLASFIGFCDQKDEKILVYKKDDIVNGSLTDHVLSRDIESLTWKKRLEIGIGAAKGLHYLHTGAKRAIFHRDVKPANILLDKSMVPKLWQLGFSLQGKISNSKSIPIEVDFIYGTYGFMAPEYYETNTFTDKCDVYSFGMVLLSLACTNYNLTIRDKIEMFRLEEEIAFLEDHNEVLDENVLTGDNFWDKFLDAEIIDPIHMRLIALPCLEVYMDITKRCLKSDPNERPAMGEVEVELEHALALQEEEEKFWKL